MKRKKKGEKKNLELKKEKQEKLVVGLSHSGVATILAPVHCPMVLAYLGITGGTFCKVLVHGRGPGLISMMFPCLSLHILSTVLSSVVCCWVCSICPAWSPRSH